MSFREGRGQLMIFSAVLTILWNLCASASVQWENHTVLQYSRICSSSPTLFFLRTHTKCRHCWAFLMTAVVFSPQERSTEMVVPSRVKLWTLSTHLSFMKRGSVRRLSKMISLVFLVFKIRL